MWSTPGTGSKFTRSETVTGSFTVTPSRPIHTPGISGAPPGSRVEGRGAVPGRGLRTTPPEPIFLPGRVFVAPIATPPLAIVADDVRQSPSDADDAEHPASEGSTA